MGLEMMEISMGCLKVSHRSGRALLQELIIGTTALLPCEDGAI